MVEARQQLLRLLAEHPATLLHMQLNVAEDGRTAVVIAEMADQSDIVTGFDLANFTDPDDADAERRLQDAFLRSHLAVVVDDHESFGDE